MKKYETFLLKMNVDDKVKEQISKALKSSHIHPPQIQRTKPGEYYHWHQDQESDSPPNLFTYIIYLNDVEKDSGGTTDFSCGKIIQPKAGKIMFSPQHGLTFIVVKLLKKVLNISQQLG